MIMNHDVMKQVQTLVEHGVRQLLSSREITILELRAKLQILSAELARSKAECAELAKHAPKQAPLTEAPPANTV
jgi:uncharacterized small protein (DUF1192 family)